MRYPILTAEEAAEYVGNGMNVAFSGFTACGTPKAIPVAIAQRAKKEHEAGREFKINVFSGASTNDCVDGELSRANAVNKRTPYQSCPDTRKAVNAGVISYFDLHLSELAQKMRYNTFGPLDVAVLEVQSIDDEGNAVLGTGIGASPTFAMMAGKVLLRHVRLTGNVMSDDYGPMMIVRDAEEEDTDIPRRAADLLKKVEEAVM